MNFTLRKESIFAFPYFLMVFAAFMVPSDGNHGLFSLKSLTFLSCVGSMALYAFMRQKLQIWHLKLMLFLTGAAAFLILWLGISTWQDETTALAQIDQFKLFFLTVIIPLTTFYLVSEGVLTSQQIFKAVIYASFLYALFKTAIVVLHLLGVIDVWKMFYMLGVRYMRMSIYGGLDRLQTSVDIATPFIIFFVLQAERLGLNFPRYFRGIYFGVSLFSTFLSFSRYLIFVYVVSCFLYWLTLNLRYCLKSLVFLFFALIAAYFAVGPDNVAQIVERRMHSKDNYKSDEVRYLQVGALLRKFEESPVIGAGIGGYAPDNIREKETLHLYEVQWMAFLMQFGLIGILVLLAPLAYIGYRIVKGPFTRVKWSFLGLFLLWLFSGFTNPFLISLTSGIIYSLFYLCPDALDFH